MKVLYTTRSLQAKFGNEFYFEADIAKNNWQDIEAALENLEIEYLSESDFDSDGIEIIGLEGTYPILEQNNIDIEPTEECWEALEAISCYSFNEMEVLEYLFGEGFGLEEVIEKKDDIGYYEGTAVEYVRENISEIMGEIPSHLESYIDYESIAKDMECKGDLVELDNITIIYPY